MDKIEGESSVDFCLSLNSQVKKEINNLHNNTDSGILTALLNEERFTSYRPDVNDIQKPSLEHRGQGSMFVDKTNNSQSNRDLLSQTASHQSDRHLTIEDFNKTAEDQDESNQDRSGIFYQQQKLSEYRMLLERARDKMFINREKAKLLEERNLLKFLIDKQKTLMQNPDTEKSLTNFQIPRQITSQEEMRISDVMDNFREGKSRRLLLLRYLAQRLDMNNAMESDNESFLQTLISELSIDTTLPESTLKKNLYEDNEKKLTHQGQIDKTKVDLPIETRKWISDDVNDNILNLHKKIISVQQLILVTCAFVIGLVFSQLLNVYSSLSWGAGLSRK